MNRLEILQRLGTVYKLMEEIHSVEARRAAAELGQVAVTLSAEERLVGAARTGGRDAVRDEDRLRRIATTAQSQMANLRKYQLEPIFDRRHEANEQAGRRYQESRLWNERMKNLIAREMERSAKSEGRREQAASDDRSLASSRRAKKGSRKR
ncbi:hypothetical protein [Edaphobacter albus]|uniref:hypothetical protein n=1 Tax=Edaphobacter sp. 4G125 TaxID=2763071 RepID=UPI001644633B|nr:hypothetical protein [Edaphobacter sp. 4G125]QNI35269.1 hypothetical protein H7846_09120 [Edaphobacter sp. 4G125]